jgi:hypothetical protein
MTMIQVNLPANAKLFYQVIIEMSSLELFDIDILTSFMFPFLESEITDEPSADRRLIELAQEVYTDDTEEEA